MNHLPTKRSVALLSALSSFHTQPLDHENGGELKQNCKFADEYDSSLLRYHQIVQKSQFVWNSRA